MNPAQSEPNDIDQGKVNDLLKGIKIPSQPQILVDIQMELVSPFGEMQVIADLIAKDVALSASVLKVVNSPFFGLVNTITSISQAINLMGSQSITNLVNAVVLKNSISGDDVTEMTKFWDNASDIAAACTTIAKKIKYPSPDDAYSLGLFHDCAIPMMMGKHTNYRTIIESGYSQKVKRVIDIENSHLESNHAVVGYFIARSWKLPKHLVQAIAQHHDIDRVFALNPDEVNETKTLLALLKIAEHLCGTHNMIGNQNTDYEYDRIKGVILNYLGFSDIDVENIRDDLQDLGIGFHS